MIARRAVVSSVENSYNMKCDSHAGEPFVHRPFAHSLALAAFAVTTLLLPSSPAHAAHVICVDPGHGGSDPGAVGCGLKEEDVTLDVGLRLQALLQADPDLTPILTRTTDTSVSLSSRAAYANANGAARFASIHCNAYDSTASGIETYCYTYGSATSFDQRDRIQAHMLATWPALPDRGGKTAGFFVIKNTSMPATLSELAFIDHCSPDAQLLGNPAERQRAAEAHHAALRASLGLGSTTPPPVTDGILRGVIFEDQGVGAADMSIRVPGALIEAVGADGVSYSTASDAPTASWAVSVPASSYAVTASAAGYVPGSRSCAVTAGGETWCSIGLLPEEVTPPDETGSAIGVVYVDDDGMDQRLPGALVTVSGQGVSFSTTAASPDAMWMFDLAPGAYTVHASHAGYYDGTQACQVSASEVSWCSVGLVPEPDTPPPADKGRLMGYVYENTGAGADDMSIKLVGAVVVATAADGQQALTSTTATALLWQLDLAEGLYTVTVSRLGYQDKSRACEVSAGQDSWCSVGLLPSGAPTDPPDTTQPDATTPPDTTTSPDPSVDTTGPPDSAASPDSWTMPSDNPDGAGPSAPGEDWMGMGIDARGGTGYTPPANSVRGAEGCSVGTEGRPMAGALVSALLLILLALRRRDTRAIRGLSVILTLALVGPAAAQEALSLTEVQARTAAQGFSQPIWSPDGAHLAVAGPGFASLLILPARGGAAAQVAQGRQSGYEPVWSSDGQSIAWRAPGQRGAEVPLMASTLDGRAAPPPANPAPGRWLLIDEAQQVSLRVGQSSSRLSQAGDRYFGAALSPGGAYAVYQGLTRGLFVHELSTGRAWALGAGTQPRFDAGGRRLAFERCEDDGTALIGCELFIATLGQGAPRLQRVEGAPPLARYPALSPDGAWLAFELDGGVFVGRLSAP
jgi:N-acetylmuramoyl-L-alanine amidase